jgi:hypothetical protein
MFTTVTNITTLTLAIAAGLTISTPAQASGVDDLKKHLERGQKLWDEVKGVEADWNRLSASAKQKLEAKKERLKNAAQSFRLVADALKGGKPIPLYLTKPSGQTVSCGDKVFVHNAAQDKVLRSEAGSGQKPMYVAVNLGWNGKETLKAPNIRVECRDKADGKPLLYGDAFTLKVDPDRDRPDGKNLDDGKPYFYAGTKAGYDPIVRLGDKGEIEKWKAYWFFRGGEGGVQTGIPMEMIATNRPTGANIGGFCGVGPKGVYPVVRFGMSNHCGHVELVAGMVSEGVGKPPRWTVDLASEVKSLAQELKKEIDAAKTGSGSSPSTTKAKPPVMKKLPGALMR